MPKRDIRSAATDLHEFAAEAGLPSQHTERPKEKAKPKEVRAASLRKPARSASGKPARAAKKRAEEPRAEPQVRVAVNMPETLQEQLHIKAVKEKTSMRALILTALKKAGYDVRDEDLRDGRRAVV